MTHSPKPQNKEGLLGFQQSFPTLFQPSLLASVRSVTIKAIGAIFLLLASGTRLAPNHSSRLIVWNVGQGQWVTASSATLCLHIDSGGEQMDWAKLLAECQRKRNIFAPTHLDWDHISFLPKAARLFKRSCLVRPLVGLPSRQHQHRKKWLQFIPSCETNIISSIPWLRHQPQSARTSNGASAVDCIADEWLISGDSPQRQEKRWQKNLPLGEIRRWILGHHGSKTSNSKELLESLPRLQWAVASARKSKYGHPHASVKRRLKKAGIALLRTETWGTIRSPLQGWPQKSN